MPEVVGEQMSSGWSIELVFKVLGMAVISVHLVRTAVSALREWRSKWG